MGFPVGSVVMSLPVNSGDLGWIPGSGRSPAEGNTHSSILAWQILWTEQTGRVRYDLATKQQKYRMWFTWR